MTMQETDQQVAGMIESVPPAPPVIGLFEVVLEVADLAASEAFYAGALGLTVVERCGEDRPATWFALGAQGFLGLWPPETGGAKAIAGGRGGSHVHLAIRVPSGTLAQMEERLVALWHRIVERRDFGPGDLAIYLLDPDENVVELTERATLWGGAPAAQSAL